jgi:hypothetical protein
MEGGFTVCPACRNIAGTVGGTRIGEHEHQICRGGEVRLIFANIMYNPHTCFEQKNFRFSIF